MEARIRGKPALRNFLSGRPPVEIALVRCQLDKLKNSLETIVGQMERSLRLIMTFEENE